jgi:saccharopine dehydrogenase-like NADP-dependent oxidoreductase
MYAGDQKDAMYISKNIGENEAMFKHTLRWQKYYKFSYWSLF